MRKYRTLQTLPALLAGALAVLATQPPPPMGVCPPFQLRDEAGNVINPVRGINATAPYSPKQTCGMTGCHDYHKITEGFHFTQGKGEAVPSWMAERYRWVTAPGNYGGTWCSPAPLYRQLAAKTNTSARVIDLTSFEFVTASCGACHPGGGPLEFDRAGNRYDQWMADPANNLTPGSDNQFDGDYFKGRWSQSGVIEADCLLCHLPEYDYRKRSVLLADLNFRWAATEAAGLGRISGRVAQGETPVVSYDMSKFDSNGFVRVMHLAPQPRNETCLHCHSKPGWKKRGASFSARTDVHIAAGLRCVDCHTAGSKASDPRIRGKEVHQIGKGDDPSGHVRNDLDDTVRACADCHIQGWNNAPRATHEWLPPLHMERISCQACHIPHRSVKAALVQASDVFNPAPYIEPSGKRIWTFYDQEMNFWNHYGELTMLTVQDQPTDLFRPTLFRYKGKIYPGNRVHSAWVGYEEDGQPGLNMLFMRDYFGMWKSHRDSFGANYAALATIKDDSGDGVPEINRPDEIDAVLAATKEHLIKTAFPLDGKRLVWVMGDRAYSTGTEFRLLPREEHEATAYASVHKFSHDVAPARAALGAGGCTDCHAHGSSFFAGKVLDVPFDQDTSAPRWIVQASILGLSPGAVWWSATREQWLKPAEYILLALVTGMIILLALRGVALRHSTLSRVMLARLSWMALAGLVVGGMIVARSPGLPEYMTVRRFTLDAAHFAVSFGVLILAVVLALQQPGKAVTQCTPPVLAGILWALIAWTGLCGVLILLRPAWLDAVVRLAYTGFDIGVLLLTLVAATDLARRLFGLPCSAAGAAT